MWSQKNSVISFPPLSRYFSSSHHCVLEMPSGTGKDSLFVVFNRILSTGASLLFHVSLNYLLPSRTVPEIEKALTTLKRFRILHAEKRGADLYEALKVWQAIGKICASINQFWNVRKVTEGEEGQSCRCTMSQFDRLWETTVLLNCATIGMRSVCHFITFSSRNSVVHGLRV